MDTYILSHVPIARVKLCMHVSVYAYMHEHMNGCTYVRTYACMYIHMYACMCSRKTLF